MKDDPKKKSPAPIVKVRSFSLQSQDTQSVANPALMRASVYLGRAKNIVFLILLFFVLAMVMLFRDTITVDNFRYLARYLNVGSSFSGFSDNFATLHYTSDSQNHLSLYRGDVVLCNSVGIRVKSTTDRDIYQSDLFYTEPVLLTGDRYFLCYDLGGTNYSLHNTFATLHNAESQYAITDAALAQNGAFAIVTESDLHRSVVTVYDNDFEPRCTVKKDKIITDVALNEKGEQLLVISCGTKNGDFFSEILLCSTKTGETEYVEEFPDLMAVQCTIWQDGSFAVLSDKGILCFDAYAKKTADLPFPSLPSSFCMANGYTAYAVSNNLAGADSTVTVLDQKGNAIRSAQITGKIISMQIAQNSLCILSSDTFCRISLQQDNIQYCTPPASATGLLAVSDKGAYLCSATQALYYDFSECFS